MVNWRWFLALVFTTVPLGGCSGLMAEHDERRIDLSAAADAGYVCNISIAQNTQADEQRVAPHAIRELDVDGPYLHMPGQHDAAEHIVRLYVGDEKVREFSIALAPGEPDIWVYAELHDWIDQTVRIEIKDLGEDTLLQRVRIEDELPGADELYRETYRPQFHFTAARGWINDPNGMLYYDGLYHLYFQHNPYGTEWGNMTWGHAVSEDMIHWRQRRAALYPDELGRIFSGGGIVDYQNSTGWATEEHDPIVLFYTSAGGGELPQAAGQPFTQSIAYSTDGGRTFTKYSGNPVIEHIAGGNRDPNVFWHEPSEQWIMTLWIRDDRFDLLGSTDLREWTTLSEFQFPDGYECPDLLELPVDGDPDDTRWVFWEAAGNYIIADFDGEQFIPQTEVLEGVFGDNDYAGQTFTTMPEGDTRSVQIAWMRSAPPRTGDRRVSYPDMPFNQQMSIPRELSLRTTPEGIRLHFEPVAELEGLRQRHHAWSDLEVNEEIVLGGPEGELYDIALTFELGDDTEVVGTSIRGHAIEYDLSERTLTALGSEAPLDPIDNRITLRILVDRTSVEVFANHGRVQIANLFLPDADQQDLSIYATGDPARVISVDVWELRSIYE